MGISSYLNAAKHVTNAHSKIHAINADSTPDMADIYVTAMNAKASERQSAILAEKKIREAGINALSKVKSTRVGLDAKEKINDMKVSNFRKAGIIGALGTVAAGGVAAVQNNQADKRAAEREARAEALEQRRIDLLNSSKSGGTNSFDQWLEDNPAPEPYKPGSSSSDKPISSGQSVASGDSKGSGGKMFTQSQMQDLAVQAGFSPENAKIMAAIGMGESGGDSRIDTSMTIDPGKKNEYSIGLVQINAQAHKDKLDRRGWTEEDLRDPLKNMTIAKEVYDEVGSFKPWSVYTSGDYTKFL